MKKTILILTLIIGFTSCNSSKSPTHVTKKSKTVETSEIIKKLENKVNNDTIKYDDFYYPIDSNLTTKILKTGIFHSDEVCDNVDKVKWFGLYKNKKNYYIDETLLKTKRVHDVVIDEKETQKTGWEIETINKETPILLIESLKFISKRKVQNIELQKDEILPGDTLKIFFLGHEYKIFATGGKKKTQDNPEYYDVWNYKLFLTTTIKGIQYKSLLVAQPNFDDNMIDIIFAGDIDGDGILDLIIDTSRHYNATCPTLYLSRPAEKGEILKPIGIHISVGC